MPKPISQALGSMSEATDGQRAENNSSHLSSFDQLAGILCGIPGARCVVADDAHVVSRSHPRATGKTVSENCGCRLAESVLSAALAGGGIEARRRQNSRRHRKAADVQLR